MNVDHTLAALADPTRRGVVELLRRRPRRAGALAEALSVTAAALSRHLRILRQHGLVELAGAQPDDARVRVYRLRPAPFVMLRSWLEQVEASSAVELDERRGHAKRSKPRW